MDLAPEMQRPARAIYALLSAGLVDLEETKSSHLKVYGAVPEVVKNKLDPELDRAIALLEEMTEVVEGKGGVQGRR